MNAVRKTPPGLGTILALLIVAWTATALGETGPRQTLEAADKQLRAILATNPPQGSKAEKSRSEKLRSVASQLLDIDQMARDALGECWAQLTDTEREEYLGLVRRLIERSYLRQAEAQLTYQVRYGTLSVDRDRAWVEALVEVDLEARELTVQIVFEMVRREGRWRVVEIETDGLRLVRSYQTQFVRLVRLRGSGELLRRMRARLAELGAD